MILHQDLAGHMNILLDMVTFIKTSALAVLVLTLSLVFSACQNDENEVSIYQPIIHEVIPQEAPVNSIVKIVGARFSVDPEINIVKCGDVNLKVISASADTLWVKIPQGAKSGRITVGISDVKGLVPAASAIEFTVLAPIMESYLPANGIPGDTVLIKGKYFNPGSADFSIKINGESLGQLLEKSDSSLKIRLAKTISTGRVILTTFGQVVTGNTFVVLPNITLYKPTTVPEGAVLTLQGTNFSSAPQVRFNGIIAAVKEANDSLIKVIVPKVLNEAETEVVAEVRVIVGEGESKVTPVKVLPSSAPVIYNLNPAVGNIGSEIEIQGEKFGTSTENITVEFNGINGSKVLAPVLALTDKKIKVNVPVGTVTGSIFVTVNQLTAEGGPFTLPFNYNAITPDLIWEGSTMTVLGNNFAANPDDISVSFYLNEASGGGTIELHPLTVSQALDKISVIVPRGTKSNMPIIVTVNEESLSREDLLLKITRPSPKTVSPTLAPVGSIVEIQGSGFSNNESDNLVFFSGKDGITIPAEIMDGPKFGLMRVRVPDGATEGYIYVQVLESSLTKGPYFKVGTPPPAIYLAKPSEGLFRLTFEADPQGGQVAVMQNIFNQTGLSEVFIDKDENKIFVRNLTQIWCADIVQGSSFTWKELYKNSAAVNQLTSVFTHNGDLFMASSQNPLATGSEKLKGTILKGNTAGTLSPLVIHNESTGFIQSGSYKSRMVVDTEGNLIWMSKATDEIVMRATGPYNISTGTASGSFIDILYEAEELLVAAGFQTLAEDVSVEGSNLLLDMDIDDSGKIFFCYGVPVPNASSTPVYGKIFTASTNSTDPVDLITNDNIGQLDIVRSITLVGDYIYGILEGGFINGLYNQDVIFRMRKDGSAYEVLYRIPNSNSPTILFQAIGVY